MTGHLHHQGSPQTASEIIEYSLPVNLPGRSISVGTDTSLEAIGDNLRHLVTSATKDYRPLWKLVDSVPSRTDANTGNRTFGKLDFEVDFFRRGEDARSYKVECLIAVTPLASPPSNWARSMGDGVTIRPRNTMQWVGRNLSNTSVGYDNFTILEMMTKLAMEASGLSGRSMPHALEHVDQTLLVAARASLKSILRAWLDSSIEDELSLRDELMRHFYRFTFSSGVDEFLEEEEADTAFVSCLFQAMSEVGAEKHSSTMQDFLLRKSSAERSSVRYAAVEALSHRMDKRVSEILSLRLRSEDNRTVAALIAASLD